MSKPSETQWELSFSGTAAFIDRGAEWNQSKGIVWALIDSESVIISPPEMIEDTENYSWWLALLDLLAFGAGWEKIASSLTNWRLEGYPKKTPLLRFVRDNWGDTVSALELYLYLHPWASSDIDRHCASATGIKPAGEERGPTLDQEELRLLMMFAWESEKSEDNGKLVSALNITWNLEPEGQGGNDSAHLAAHFCLTWHDQSLFELSENDTITADSLFTTLTSTQYEGWYSKIHEVRKLLLEDLDFRDNADLMLVTIEGVGDLGMFKFDQKLQRFIRH